jgi:hypothetical protein
MKHINKFLTFLNEGIKASEAYQDLDSIQTVIDGKRDLAFLVLSTQKLIDPRSSIEALNLAINSGLNLLPVGNRKEGVAFVIYKNDLAAAQELANFAASKGGYLNDETPEEAELVGNLLNYSPADIADYSKKYQK